MDKSQTAGALPEFHVSLDVMGLIVFKYKGQTLVFHPGELFKGLEKIKADLYEPPPPAL